MYTVLRVPFISGLHRIGCRRWRRSRSRRRRSRSRSRRRRSRSRRRRSRWRRPRVQTRQPLAKVQAIEPPWGRFRKRRADTETCSLRDVARSGAGTRIAARCRGGRARDTPLSSRGRSSSCDCARDTPLSSRGRSSSCGWARVERNFLLSRAPHTACRRPVNRGAPGGAPPNSNKEARHRRTTQPSRERAPTAHRIAPLRRRRGAGAPLSSRGTSTSCDCARVEHNLLLSRAPHTACQRPLNRGAPDGAPPNSNKEARQRRTTHPPKERAPTAHRIAPLRRGRGGGAPRSSRGRSTSCGWARVERNFLLYRAPRAAWRRSPLRGRVRRRADGAPRRPSRPRRPH